MDQNYIQKLCHKITLELRKIEARLYHDDVVDLTEVMGEIKQLQQYLSMHMSEHPSEHLKKLVYDTFFEIQGIAAQLQNKVKATQHRLAELKSSQKLNQAYTYGVRK